MSQGKRTFEQQWGKRENADDWQRINRTVVALNQENPDSLETLDNLENLENDGTVAGDSIASGENAEPVDSAAFDPHNREYYLAQIPFTEEQLAASHDIIKDGLYNALRA